jgi:hypothetical protein
MKRFTVESLQTLSISTNNVLIDVPSPIVYRIAKNQGNYLIKRHLLTVEY